MEDSDWDYDSGPYCRHWYDLWECEQECALCGHCCTKHEDDETCNEGECKCPGWSNKK